jgi:glycosyltransferase involved in cell wall biosynthesis
VYDVTDDWRSMPQRDADRAALIAAEDALAARARTIVCSDVLAERWRERYGIDPAVVPNGVDVDAIRTAEPRDLGDHGPHAVYVGTLHTNRLDIDLVEAVAHDKSVTVRLVGPDHLDEAARVRLLGAGVVIHGAVPSADVPSWLVAADVLICPHIVDDFTISLDAIKAHEYLATDQPIVATPTSGFQSLTAPGLTVAGSTAFVAGVRAGAGTGPYDRPRPPSWAERADVFAAALAGAAR